MDRGRRSLPAFPFLNTAIDAFRLRSSSGGQALRSVLSTACRIVRQQGSGRMDTWESFFREKSRRRYARRSREKIVKAAILLVLLGGIAVAIFLQVAGLPR